MVVEVVDVVDDVEVVAIEVSGATVDAVGNGASVSFDDDEPPQAARANDEAMSTSRRTGTVCRLSG